MERCRLVTRATIEERMMQQAKGKMVLEHLVVQKMGKPQQMKQQELDDLLRRERLRRVHGGPRSEGIRLRGRRGDGVGRARLRRDDGGVRVFTTAGGEDEEEGEALHFLSAFFFGTTWRITRASGRRYFSAAPRIVSLVALR